MASACGYLAGGTWLDAPTGITGEVVVGSFGLAALLWSMVTR